MKTREEEIRENLSILQPHVTAFSAQLPLYYKHQDEVTVGGKVLSILDMNRLGVDFNAPYGESLMPNEDLGVYITVNDELGQTILVMFQSTYRKIIAEVDGNLIGKWITGNGQVAVINKSLDDMDFVTHVGKIIKGEAIGAKHPNEEITPRVFCYGVKVIKTA